MASHKNETYHEQIKKSNKIKLRELEEQLPKFCKDFFRGIDNQTAPRTKIAYAYDLIVFFNYIIQENPNIKTIDDINIDILTKLNTKDIEEYLEYLTLYSNNNGTEHTNEEAGLKRKITSLRSFYNYYYQNGDIDSNPASLVKIPKIHNKEIVRFEPNEVAAFLDNVEAGNNLTNKQLSYHNKTKTRDLALLTLLLGTGIRVSECVGLDINDVDFDNNGIKITRKGGNESIVYFGDEVCDALKAYMEERQSITPCDGHDNALFLSIQKKRINVRSVENLVGKYAKTVTTVKHITPHKLRSTYGTNLYQETGDIYLVADVLGHKDVNTTKKHYADIGNNKRRSAANVVKLRKD